MPSRRRRSFSSARATAGRNFSTLIDFCLKVARPIPHRAHRHIGVAMRREEDHRDFVPPVIQPVKEIKSAHFRHLDIEDQAPGAAWGVRLQKIHGARVGHDLIPLALQHEFKQLPKRVVILNSRDIVLY